MVLVLVLGLLLLPALGGCRHDMQNQNKVRPYRESAFFPDGASARPLPAHTVPRGDLRADEAYYSGVRGRHPVAEVPFPVTRELLRRGQERYDIFCSPCHGRAGDGRGMIVTRGYKQPPSFHDEVLRTAQVGWFFNVMTQGFGVMPSYAAQIPVADRWAIAAYIRALQYSQSARLADLPPAARQAIAGELEQPSPPPSTPQGAGPGPANLESGAPPAPQAPPVSQVPPTRQTQPVTPVTPVTPAPPTRQAPRPPATASAPPARPPTSEVP
jgi:mono/diheme cytochrome c family protein